MILLGIDPAPSKKSTIFDGESFFQLDPFELKSYLENFKSYLICWDAPLGVDITNGFSSKKIETKLRQLKPPKGISILPFASCPHWTVSQFLFSLPAIATQPSNEVKLITSKKDLSTMGKYIVEVHPALTLWLWFGDRIENWHYKRRNEKKIRTTALNSILKELNELVSSFSITLPQISNDDELDAFTAWFLGYLLLHYTDFVDFKGSSKEALLLPNVQEIRHL